LHAIGRRFEPVHLHIAPALILLWSFFCTPAPAVDPYPQTGPALDVYQQFVDHLASRDFSSLYPLLDEVSQAYLECSLDIVREIKAAVDANPSRLKPEEIATLQLMFSAKDAPALLTLLMDRFFPPIGQEELARLRCIEITPISPTMYKLQTVSGREFLLVNQKSEWKLDLSDRFLAFYEELTIVDVQIRDVLNSQ
jgi:hypothetical protein